MTKIENKLMSLIGEEVIVTFIEPGPSNQGLSQMTGIAGYIDDEEKQIGVFNNETGRTLKASDIWNFVSEAN